MRQSDCKNGNDEKRLKQLETEKARLEARNKKLTEDASYLRQVIRAQKLGNTNGLVKRESATKLARTITKTYEPTANAETLGKILAEVHEKMKASDSWTYTDVIDPDSHRFSDPHRMQNYKSTLYVQFCR